MLKLKQIQSIVVKSILVICLSIFLVSCSSTSRKSGSIAKDYVISVPKIDDDSKSPFALELLEEINVNNNLNLKVRVNARAPFDIAQDYLTRAILRLANIQDGEVQEQVAAIVKEYQPEQGREEESLFPIDVPLKISSNHGNFYQLELLWGSDVSDQEFSEASLLKEKSSKVEIVESRVEKRFICVTDPCELSHTMYATLLNSGDSRITRVTLGVSYVWLDKGEEFNSSSYVPENESKLLIADIDLISGSKEKVVLDLEKRIAERPDGEFFPIVRVLEFN